MELESKPKAISSSCSWQTLNYSIIYTLILTILFILLRTDSSPSIKWTRTLLLGSATTREPVKVAGEITFLPLKDLRFADTAMEGNTWFMSSLNDIFEEGEAEYLRFPSRASDGRLLCLKGRDIRNGSRNSYALARSDSLPEQSVLLKGLTFVSDSYYIYENLWHGINAMGPFVGWSMKNKCKKPDRWILYFQGEVRVKMGSWVRQVMEANFGDVPIERFEGDGEEKAYCLEEAVVMRHNMGKMGMERKLKVCDLLRCKARQHCGVKGGNGVVVDKRGDPVIRLTLLMRRGSRSFKNATAVVDVFAKECERVRGCELKVAQSEELSFCDQVRVMSATDIVVSPHGAQLTNMLFMDRGSSVMEFFPKGWLELAGIGQYAHHWLANLSGMKHRGSWWEPLGKKECPKPNHDLDCFRYYKDGQVGHNETHFAIWARDVLNQVSMAKRKDLSAERLLRDPSRPSCAC